MQKSQPEPWLRGTHLEIPAVPRAVLHALELAQEDLTFWCGELSEPELIATPSGLPSIAFHLRHIARSLDRLLTYAEGRQLNDRQLQALTSEADALSVRRLKSLTSCRQPLTESSARILKLGETARHSESTAHRRQKESAHHRCRPSRAYRRSHPKACRTGDNDGKNAHRAPRTSPLTTVGSTTDAHSSLRFTGITRLLTGNLHR